MSRPSGFKHTEETKQKMRVSHPHLSRPHTNEEKRQVSDKMKEWHRLHKHPMKGKKASEETRMKMSLVRRGNHNSNWKGGLTALVKGIRRSPKFYQWRKAVLERDGFTCRDCASRINLDAHHIQSIIDYPDWIFEVDNGLTLCENCHKRHTAWQNLRKKRTKCKIRISSG